MDDQRKELEKIKISKEISKILGLKSKMIQSKGAEEKDRIIEILREEVSLINSINEKVMEEKDKLIIKLEQIIEEKESKIRVLKERLKHETDYPFL